LLHAREENHEEKLHETSSLVVTDQDGENANASNDVTLESRTLSEDSGNESLDSDSEDRKEEQIKKISNDLVGMNVSISRHGRVNSRQSF
jgi:hypothetical protein